MSEPASAPPVSPQLLERAEAERACASCDCARDCSLPHGVLHAAGSPRGASPPLPTGAGHTPPRHSFEPDLPGDAGVPTTLGHLAPIVVAIASCELHLRQDLGEMERRVLSFDVKLSHVQLRLERLRQARTGQQPADTALASNPARGEGGGWVQIRTPGDAIAVCTAAPAWVASLAPS